jgi:hypothetical protein
MPYLLSYGLRLLSCIVPYLSDFSVYQNIALRTEFDTFATPEAAAMNHALKEQSGWTEIPTRGFRVVRLALAPGFRGRILEMR